jgi:hypothetical protein
LLNIDTAATTNGHARGAAATTTMDDPSQSLLKGSILSFDARMSTISNNFNIPFRRMSSSGMSGRSSLRNFTQQFRFSDVSMASEIFEANSVSTSDELETELCVDV